MIKKIFQNWAPLLIIGISAFVLLPFFVLSFYNVPAVDDFTYITIAVKKGFLEAQQSWYNAWSGRYTATALLSINPIRYSLFGYKLIPILVLILLIYGVYFLFSVLFDSLKVIEKIAISLLFIIVYIYLMPKIVSGIYWFPGSGSYQLANVFSLFFIGNLVRFYKFNHKKYLIYSVIFLFLLIGGNETSMFLVDILLLISFLLYQFKITRTKKIITLDFFLNKKLFLLIIGVLAFLFSLIVIVAPGNQIRMGIANKHQMDSFFKAFDTSKDYFADWFFSLFLFSVILIYFIRKIPLKNLYFFKVHPIKSLLIFLLVSYIGFFPAFWSMGHKPPLRTVNVIYFFYLFTGTYFFITLYFHIRNKKYFTFISKTPNYIFIIIGFVTLSVYVISFPSGNISTAYSDWLDGTAKEYNKEIDKRYALIKEFKLKNKEEPLIITRIKTRPKTLYFWDISTDTKNWRNKSYAEFWGIHSIRFNEEN